MKLYSILSNLITNKYVLYLVAAAALLNIFAYIALGNFHAVIFFILVGYIISSFSKNMIIILLGSMSLCNFLIAGMKVKEGLVTLSGDQKKKELPIVPPLDYTDQESAVQSEEFKTQQQPLDSTNVSYDKRKNSQSQSDNDAKIEEAYDTLNKIISGPEFSSMTEDAKKLMNHQKNLAESINQIGPILENMKPFLQQTEEMLRKMEAKGAA